MAKPRTDLTGLRFGRLKVRELHHVESGHGYWTCDCKCGEEVIIRDTHLTAPDGVSGATRSCGCWRSDPDVRRAARLVTPPRDRKRIAKLGGQAAADLAAVRWAKPDARSAQKAGGRPRSDAPRCPCGKSTLKRAKARAFDCCKKAGVR